MQKKAFVVLVLFALIGGLVSFPNHFNFRTFGLDLGLYTHVAFDYAHGQIDDSSLFLASPQSILADHFDLHLFIWAPLTYLFGSWTLLIVQWFFTIVGALGVYKLIGAVYDERSAFWALVVFATSWGLYSALCFDMHSSVVSAMVVPWFLLAAFRGNMWLSIALLLFVLVGKESEGLWLFFLCMGGYLWFRQVAVQRKALLAFAGISLLYSSVILGMVMPLLSANDSYAHFEYSVLGNGLADAAMTSITRPVEVFIALFQSNGDWNAVKIESLLVFLMAGGWACIVNPRFLLMLLPIFGFKLLNDQPPLWGLNAHYSVEFAPIIAIAAGHLVHKYRFAWLPFALLLGSAGATLHVMDGSQQYQERARSRFYQWKHYHRSWGVADSYEALAMIPPQAAVSAQSPYIPHVALREKVYQFPIILDAEYILLNPLDVSYPLDSSNYRQALQSLHDAQIWELLYESESAILFKRATSPSKP